MKDAKTNPYTVRAIARAIKAAQRCNLRIIAVQPDGTVLIGDPVPMGPSPGRPVRRTPPNGHDPEMWEKARELLGDPTLGPPPKRIGWGERLDAAFARDAANEVARQLIETGRKRRMSRKSTSKEGEKIDMAPPLRDAREKLGDYTGLAPTYGKVIKKLRKIAKEKQ